MAYLDKYSDEDLFQILDSNVEQELHKRGYEYGWHKVTGYAGSIYILVNPAFPNLVKIGYADDVKKRVKGFNRNSGLPDPYHIYATYKVKKRLEDLKLHSLIDSLDSNLRHSKNREFYEMSPEKAYEILSAIAQINGDEDLLVLDPLNDEYFEKEKAEETSKPYKNITEKPVTIRFTKDNESIVFKTWRALEMSVADKCIEEYGCPAFEKFVLDQSNAMLHTKKKNQFGETSDLMIASAEIRKGLFMNTNNSANTILSICRILTDEFPDASFKLIYKGNADNN